jgi:hypothetical protein
MNNSRTILITSLLTCIYIITIKAFKINMKKKQLVYYSAVFFLCSFSTSKILDKIFPQKIEHLSDYKDIQEMKKKKRQDREDILARFEDTISRKRDADMKKIRNIADQEEKDTCEQMEEEIVARLGKSRIAPLIKNIQDDPFHHGLCTQEDLEACTTVDMSKFVLNESVPKCDYVLPEQYNLFPPRKGYTPGDPAEDPTLDTLINKDNYILFFVAFVTLIAIYIAVLMFKSVFK